MITEKSRFTAQPAPRPAPLPLTESTKKMAYAAGTHQNLQHGLEGETKDSSPEIPGCSL